jgi:hypothetical protein
MEELLMELVKEIRVGSILRKEPYGIPWPLSDRYAKALEVLLENVGQRNNNSQSGISRRSH